MPTRMLTVVMVIAGMVATVAAQSGVPGSNPQNPEATLWFEGPLFLLSATFGILALRGARWAYVSFIALGLLYFPLRVGFQLNPQPCNMAVDVPLALRSLANIGHLSQFAIFFVLTSAQMRMNTWSAFAWAGLATLAYGASVEVAQAVTGRGYCRLRDLLPDTAGALIGAGVVLLWERVRFGVATRADRLSRV